MALNLGSALLQETTFIPPGVLSILDRAHPWGTARCHIDRTPRGALNVASGSYQVGLSITCPLAYMFVTQVTNIFSTTSFIEPKQLDSLTVNLAEIMI
mgnify:CR=1 FL=1